MPVFTSIAPLLTCDHVAEDRREEFTVFRECALMTLEGAWNTKRAPEHRTREEFTRLVDNLPASNPVRNAKGVDLLPAAATLIGLWLFVTQEAKKGEAALARVLPETVRKTWSMLENTSRAEREELQGLMAPVWPWLQQHEGAIYRHAGGHDMHLLEIMQGPQAATTARPRNGLIPHVIA